MPDLATDPAPDAVEGAQRRNALGRSTRDLLLVTAERLFALRGIDAVSLREIAQAAGQRNNTALQYYFGTRVGLIDAIHSMRAASLNQDRLDLLAQLDEDATVQQLIEIMIRPYAESVADPDSHYVGFLSRLLSERGSLEKVTSREAVDAYLGARDDVEARLFALQPGVSHRTITRRFHQVLAWAIVAFAALARSGHTPSHAESTHLLADLTPMLAAALTAPPA